MLTRITITALMLSAAAAHAADRPPGPDKDAPVISDLNVTPSAGPVGTRYTVAVRISDPRGPADIVPTLYQIRERMESIPLPINDRGRDGDAVAGDGVYTGAARVPPTAAAGTHTFSVFVRNTAGRHSNTLLYQFTVLKGDMVERLRRQPDGPRIIRARVRRLDRFAGGGHPRGN